MIPPLKAALIGCGSVSQRGVLPHLACADARERVQLVAVVDAVAERARLSAEKFGVPRWFSNMDDMLVETDVDMVLVITPIQHHFENAMAAIAAGKHVYVQKSMTTTLDEANRLLAARDAAGVKLVAAPGFDLFPTTAQMRDIVRSGDDPLTSINPLWYYRKGAGPLPDVTIYSLQLATSILGPVVKVTALGNKLTPVRTWRDQAVEIEVEDNAVLLMEFASGAIVTGVGSDSAGSRRNPWGAIGLYGTRGALEVTAVDGATGYPLAFNVYGGGGWGTFSQEAGHRTYEQPLTAQPYLRGEHLELEEGHLYVDIMELADAIVEDRAPRATGEQARHVVEIIECTHKAMATGQTQYLTTSF